MTVEIQPGLQLGGVGLEFNVGYRPQGTTYRDRLDFSRLLDMWSYLGLPLHITLTAHSSDAPDPRAARPVEWLPGATRWTPEAQATVVRKLMPLLMSKAYVHTVTWNHLSDAEPHEFPYSGLIDDHGVAKPALTALAQIRKKHLH